MGQRKAHLEEIKREAVRLALRNGTSQTMIAHDLGIKTNLLNRWISESLTWNEDSIPASTQPNQGDYQALQRKLDAVIVERDMLKKTLIYFAADIK